MTDIKQTVRDRYARSATTMDDAPDGAPPSLGLGDPVSIAAPKTGETVLDLGSGPGKDLFAAAVAVGETGRAIGVDMTPEMIERARAGAAERRLSNVSIVDGDLERLPLPCGSVDVVMSNCVINLVPDKRRALIEAYRVLRPGGRLAILDTAFDTEPPAELREDPDKWCACVGGSLVASEYEQTLRDIGFENVALTQLDTGCGEACSTGDPANEARSVAVTATKPGSSDATTRPAVPSDEVRICELVSGAELPTDGLRTEDAVVALRDGEVVGTVAVERHGQRAVLRSLVVAEDHRRTGLGSTLTGAALDVARWSGSTEVYLFTEGAIGFFERFRFVAISQARATEAVPDTPLAGGCCSSATAMLLDFEAADLPLLGKPSRKELPTFQNGSCC